MRGANWNRRDVLKGGGAAALAWALGGRIPRLAANPLGLPIGIQVYTVRRLAAKDFAGTLKQLGAIGYQEVELGEFYGHKPAEVKQMVADAGLKAPSSHVGAEDLSKDVTKLIDTFKEIGIEYMVCSFPAHRPGKAQPMVRVKGHPFEPNFDADDYKWLAETLNKAGAQTKTAGIQLAYHPHNLDYKMFGDKPALDQLMSDTDPQLVKLELDCYWAARAGKDPVDYITRYSGRVPMLHIKDMKPGLKPTTDISKGGDGFIEVGKGSIDWKRIFDAAGKNGLKHYFVEQDQSSLEPMESARVSYDYLKNLQV